MTTSLPATGSATDTPQLFRRFSRWVSRTGVLRVTLVAAALSSIGSLALTWLIVRVVLKHASMGNAFWISLLVPLPFALLVGGLCIFLVASLERAWSTVNELAMQDALTGLSNRRFFIPAAQREIDLARRHGQPLAVVILDVDHFKSINDAFGHLRGDDVLVQIAQRCRHALRTTDLLARWGGEEFIMLLPNTPLPQALQLAERVREDIACKRRIQIDGHDLQVTASMGVAGKTPGASLSLDELIQRADSALYRAKSDGRNRLAIAGSEPSAPAERAVPAL